MKFSFLIFLLIFSFAAYSHDGSDGWVTLKDLRVWSNTYETDTIRIQVSDGYYNPARSCLELDSYMVANEVSEAAKDRIFSSLLAAKFSGANLKAFINKSSCERGRPKIMNVVID